MLTKEEVYTKLEELGVAFDKMEHEPVYTIDEMKLIEGMNIEDVCKNLFIRDEKGKRHFLVVIREDKSADLKALREQIGSTRLSFASEDRLMKHMGLTKGAVTKSMLLFAIPMILGDLLQQCYNIADTLIVGQFLGRNALAAVGSSFTLMTFLTSIILGLCMGSGALFSIRFGQRDENGLCEDICASFYSIAAATVTPAPIVSIPCSLQM